MYWNRKLLEFFGIEERDISLFLSMHQQYKNELEDRFKQKMLTASFTEGNTKMRSESYYRKSGVHDGIAGSDYFRNPNLKED